MRLANIWKATSMPMVNGVPPACATRLPSITSKAPPIRIASVMACSSALAVML